MINVKHIQDEIRAVFLHITKQAITHATDSLLEDLSFELQKILDATFIGFYVYNDWDCSYNLISTHEIDLFDINSYITKIKQSRFDHEANGVKCHFIKECDQNKYIFTLNTQDVSNSIYCLFHFNNKTISSELIKFISDEMEQFIQIFTHIRESDWEQKRSELLNKLATRIYATPNRSKVLQLIVDQLQTIYPTLKYYILLSQDYENNCALPIKELEFSQGINNRVSDKAFLSGEVQIEKRDDCPHLYAPLSGNQGVYGVIQIIAPHSERFPEKEVSFITNLAQTAGQALENVTLYQNSITLVSDLKLINNATQQLNANVKLTKLISIVKQHIIDASNAEEIGFIYINEKNSNEINIAPESTNLFKTTTAVLLRNTY